MAFRIKKLRKHINGGYNAIEVTNLKTGEVMVSDIVTFNCPCRIDGQTNGGLKLFGIKKGLKAENCSGIDITEED